MRADRLISLLMLLQAREPMTARELAERLEVSERTVYRDVRALGAAGIPVYGEPGHDGGYRLVDGYRTRLTGLTRDEAASLFLTGLPGAAADLGLGAEATAARRKLMAALPAEHRDGAGLVRDRFHLDTPAWYHDGTDRVPFLAAAAEAVWHRRPVRLRYLRWAEPHEVTRTVEPYGLVLKAGRWYLVACGETGPRTYRVARIAGLDVLDGAFERAPGFDLAAYWRDHLDGHDARRYVGDAVLRLSPAGMRLLAHVAESAVLRAAEDTATACPDGWTRVTVPVESGDQAVRDVLRLGPDAEVVAPAGLRAAVTDALAEMTRRYPAEGS